MTDQETLFHTPDKPPFNPEDFHLFARVIADDKLHIDLGAWNRARAEGAFVGQCRHCGGYLRPEPTSAYPSSPDDICEHWLGAVCIDCGHEWVAPNASVLQRSARHSRMPRTFLRTRAGVIAVPRSEGG